MKSLQVQVISKDEWATLASDAHLVVFKEIRSADMDRIDFALLGTQAHELAAYATVKELDRESCYLQYGGAVPGVLSCHAIFSLYRSFLDILKSKYKRVSTLVSNSNVRYLRLAMSQGFRIIGTRFFKGEVYVELFMEFENA